MFIGCAMLGRCIQVGCAIGDYPCHPYDAIRWLCLCVWMDGWHESTCPSPHCAYFARLQTFPFAFYSHLPFILSRSLSSLHLLTLIFLLFAFEIVLSPVSLAVSHTIAHTHFRSLSPVVPMCRH